MAVNKRLIFWLIKAYIKKWRKTIFFFFLFGLIFFFILQFFLSTIIAKFPLIEKETIGVVGAYTVDTLPDFIMEDVSQGLIKLDKHGNPQPGLASSWEVQDSGKTYIVHVKSNTTFSDGSPFTSDALNFPYSDVKVLRPNPSTLVFRLKDPYAPFLVALSHPVFKDTFIGVGQWRIKEIKVNGTFVSSLTLAGVTQPFKVRIYQFYPTQESLRLAFVLGNVSEAVNLNNLSFNSSSLSAFANAQIDKKTDYSRLVTLFFNTQDKDLSDKRLRNALSFALPTTFTQGERAYSPISPLSWAYQQSTLYLPDKEHAKLIISTIEQDTKAQLPILTISALPGYKDVADKIISAWEQVGIRAKVKTVSSRPDNFQIFLGDFNVPQDPDQYSLWHSDQEFNITKFNSNRIDKLLEDGRKTIDHDSRLKTYADFQKYLMDEAPAAFLYFPYAYTVTRK
ncbi:MAG: ABC transporter substrate-binding protein [Patescibacteria group bacterium]|nr:ABC transporter substrate-binding protein [Patescibacteria group bacterium]MDE2588649.1 ABC transporter substrate-binding protein [Patescibacteria group bacterium]